MMELPLVSGKRIGFGFEGSVSLFPRFSGSFAGSLGLALPAKRLSAVSLRIKGPDEIRGGALPGEEKRTQAVTEEVIERDLRFKPMFDKYVKVMKSVSIDRSNYSRPNTKGRRSNYLGPNMNLRKEKKSSSRKEDKDLGDARDVDLASEGTLRFSGTSDGFLGENNIAQTDRCKKPTENFEKEKNAGETVAIRIVGKLGNHDYDSEGLIKESLKPLRGIPKEENGGSSDNRSICKRIDTRSISEEKDVYQGNFERNTNEHMSSTRSLQKNTERKRGEHVFEEDTLHHTNTQKRQCESEIRNSITRRERYTWNKSRRNLRKSEIKIFEMDSNENEKIGSDNVTNMNLKRCGKFSSNGNSYSSTSVHENYKSYQELNHENNVDRGCVSKAVHSKRRFHKHGNQAEISLDQESDHVDVEERSAFKTFEVFTDVQNRPRVLRMEMEERIQNLAKRLNATDINMPEWQFSKVMHSAKIKFTDHSILRVVQILGEFGNWKRVLQIVEWLRSRERFKSYKSKYIYTAVLNVLGKAKRPMEALNIFYAMQEEKASYPDLAAYHCISVTLGQTGHMKELFDVIDRMRSPPKKKFNLGLNQKWDPRLQPDLVVYNAVLNACVQQKQWEGAFWVLQQLKKQFIRPSGTTYGLVMEVMLACGKYNLVHEFFKKVKETSIPSTLSYKVLVNTFWREGKIDEAVLAVQDMEKRGIVGSASLYYDLAQCLCRTGRYKEALMQIDNICKVAKKPLVVTYTGLMQACLDSGNIQDGVYVFNEMCKVCSPNIVTCNIMLKSYLKHDMYEEAKDLFQRMLNGSHNINSKSNLRGSLVLDKFTFNTMMDASIAAEKWDDLENFYVQMLSHGYHFDKKRHLHMVMDAARAGKVKVLETTWEYLIHSGRELPPAIIKENFRMKLKDDDCAAAISCLCVQQTCEPHAFSRHSWLNLLKIDSDGFKKDTIIRLVHEMEKRIERNEPAPLLENLLDACLTFLGSASASPGLLDEQNFSLSVK